MPPVRWKYLVLVLAVTVMVLLPLLQTTSAQHMHESISMSEDGWRPIIGTRRLPPAFESDIRINQYHNNHPNKDSDVEIVKSESTIQISSTVSPDQFKVKPKEHVRDTNIILGGNTIYHFNQANKKSPEGKLTPPPSGYHTIPTGTHRPQLSSLSGVTVGRPSQNGIKKPLLKVTSPPRFTQGGKRKPQRAPVGAHSTRDEVYIPTSGSGGFAIRKPSQSNIRTRETQGLGLFGTNQYQPGHLDFTNRYQHTSNGHTFEQFKSNPVTYIFSKGPAFKKQNDDYTRNLVPPPLQRVPNQDKDKDSTKKKSVSNFKDNVVVPSIQEPVSFGIQPITQFGLRPPQLHENLVTQLHFEPNFGFQKHLKTKEQAIDVQVTKEKLKVFHNNAAPNLAQKPAQYIDYDFHGISSNQADLPKLQTYEVTEGKWLDNPNPFTFSFQPAHGVSAPNLKPLLSTARPQFVPEPIVELNLPPFLPTPFRPEGTIASPSQTEVSTVFTQVSSKMNKYKNEQINKNPLFFDVKEVSTHYPVLGRPEFGQETQPTDTPLPMNENGEISNDISTTTQKPKPRRRRPQPRRPTTTTTTTTTTEEPTTENLSYEMQKMQDNYDSEMSVETEAPTPHRRPRPRPNRYRTNSNSYRTTTSSADTEEISSEKRVRGRNRHRQRGNNHDRYQSQRKRIRPNFSEERPYSNHKISETESPYTMSHETTEYTDQKETQGIFETKFVNPTRNNEDESTTKSNRMEYKDVPKRKQNYRIQSQEEDIVNMQDYQDAAAKRNQNYHQELNTAAYETTMISDELAGLKLTIEEVTTPPVTTTTQETTVASVNSPENEVDYTTPAITEQNIKILEPIQTTSTTTVPTTTTEAPTTKTTRSRGRPSNKYNSGNRPRFSVKDYRQRLHQYTSTTPSTTTDFVRTEGPRFRFPNRLRTRPTAGTTTSTNQQSVETEDETEPSEIINRRRFRPKEPRRGIAQTKSSTTMSDDSKAKAVNTRIRPFGRYKTSTEPSATSGNRVSIKSNLYDTAKRRPHLTMRNKLYKDKVTEETTIRNDDEVSETAAPSEKTPEFETNTDIYQNSNNELSTETSESSTVDVSDDDYSQRVSELTSSLKNEYETPGMFKTFSPNTRRIPNYFTISTEDPILPIEAFFPNLKDKEQ